MLAGGRRLAEPWLDGGHTYLLESRPDEGGRVTLLRLAADGTVTEITPAPTNVRTRVHEYGGGAWAVSDGLVVVSEFTDGHLVRVEPVGTSRPLTSGTGLRFADMRIDPAGARLLTVMEDHRTDDLDPSNSIVAVALDDGAITPLVEGGDFYSHPRLSPDGSRLCWLTWDRPNMPWDGSELWVGRLDEDGSVGSTDLIAGGSTGVDRQPRMGARRQPRVRLGSLGLVEPVSLAARHAGCRGARADGGGVRGPRSGCSASAGSASMDEVGSSPSRARSGRDRLLVLEAGSDPRELQIDAPDLDGLSVAGDIAVAVGALAHPAGGGRAMSTLTSGDVTRIRRGEHARARRWVPVAAALRGVPHHRRPDRLCVPLPAHQP